MLICACTYDLCLSVLIFVFKQKTAYEMRISDWSSDVCSSDLLAAAQGLPDALLLIAEHCGHLANVYYECGATAAGDSWHAQVIAILELSAELLPGPSSYELTQALNVAADEASPDIMEEAKMLRDLFEIGRAHV